MGCISFAWRRSSGAFWLRPAAPRLRLWTRSHGRHTTKLRRCWNALGDCPSRKPTQIRSNIDRYDQESLFDRAEVSRWKARFRGMTLDELAGLIRSNADLEVAVLRDLTREAFRAHLQRMNDPTNRYLINFNRYPLFGVDIGHFSPLGGYLADSDLVFVLDVLLVRAAVVPLSAHRPCGRGRCPSRR
jgi:hypothetical protein